MIGAGIENRTLKFEKDTREPNHLVWGAAPPPRVSFCCFKGLK